MNRPWISVHLSGLPIEDLFVYRTTVLAWTFDGTILLFTVADIEAAIHAALPGDPQLALAICIRLFHSSGKGTKRGDGAALGRLAELTADFNITLDGDAIPRMTHQSRLQANSLLDLMVYSDQVFFGTDQGLFQSAWPNPEVEMVYPRARLNNPCYCTAASLGTVAASCGVEGLTFLFNDFGYADSKSSSIKTLEIPSERVTFGQGGVFNFESRGSFSHLKAIKEDATKKRSRSPDKVIVDVHKGTLGTAGTTEMSNHVLLSDDLDYVFYSHERIVGLYQGQVLASQVRQRHGEHLVANRVHQTGTYTGMPLSVCETSSMTLIETTEGVVVAVTDSNETHFRETSPTIVMRTFPNSKRYLDLAVRTSDAGACFFADTPKMSDF